MAFEPHLFNEVSKAIRGLGVATAEARARSMAGRSYYSLFLALRVKVLAAGHRPVDSKVRHGDLSAALMSVQGTENGNTMAALGKLLQELYYCREQADYRIVCNNEFGARAQKLDAMRRMAERVATALGQLEKLDFSAVAAKLP